MTYEDTTHFADVDRTKCPDFFARFLDDVNKLSEIVACKEILIDRLRLRGGDHVLDVGCGPGADVFELAGIVGKAGRVTGLDASVAMIEEAKRRAEGRGLPVAFQVGDSQALPFDPGTFDGVRSERMLMHVPDAERAVSEMGRVLKPGGRLAVLDFDWETQFCDSPHKETTRKITQSFCDGLKSGWIGRKLPRLFRVSGMTDVAVKAQTVFIPYESVKLLLGGHVAGMQAAGAISSEEADQWWASLARADRDGVHNFGLTGFVVSGTRR